MEVLITGIRGFIGSHLADHLLAEGCSVSGLISPKDLSTRSGEQARRVRFIPCDIRDRDQVSRAMTEISPRYIFHLAAQIAADSSLLDPLRLFETNVVGTFNLLEEIKRRGMDATFLVTGTSAEYGLTDTPDRPVNEDTPYRPVSHYGISKVAQGLLAARYHKLHGMRIVRTHTFNCLGPRQGDAQAPSVFARRIAEVEKGVHPSWIRVGNLTTYRDFTDVRDVVRAYWMLSRYGKPGQTYNVCSGKAYRIGDLLNRLLELAGTQIEVIEEARLLSPGDIATQTGDNRRLVNATGWRPEIPMESSLAALLNDWRARVSSWAPAKG